MVEHYAGLEILVRYAEDCYIIFDIRVIRNAKRQNAL